MSDLRELYPEEINACTHWNELHSDANVEDDELDDSRQPATETPAQQKPDPGHLQERAAHFDHRTQHMPDDWYFKYSVTENLKAGRMLERRVFYTGLALIQTRPCHLRPTKLPVRLHSWATTLLVALSKKLLSCAASQSKREKRGRRTNRSLL